MDSNLGANTVCLFKNFEGLELLKIEKNIIELKVLLYAYSRNKLRSSKMFIVSLVSSMLNKLEAKCDMRLFYFEDVFEISPEKRPVNHSEKSKQEYPLNYKGWQQNIQ